MSHGCVANALGRGRRRHVDKFTQIVDACTWWRIPAAIRVLAMARASSPASPDNGARIEYERRAMPPAPRAPPHEKRRRAQKNAPFPPKAAPEHGASAKPKTPAETPTRC